MGPSSWTHVIISSLNIVLVFLIYLKCVLGFWINSTTNIHSTLTTDVALNQDLYAILQETLGRRGHLNAITSSINPSIDSANQHRPVISPDLAFAQARQNNPHVTPISTYSRKESYRKLLISLTQLERDLVFDNQKTVTPNSPSLHLHQVSTSPRDEDPRYNEFSSEVSNNAHAAGDTLEKILEKVGSSSAPSDRLSPVPGKRRYLGRHRSTEDESEGQFDGLYRDMCRSRTSYDLVKVAVNDALQNVEVLPNTWVWMTKCLRNNSRCPGVARGVIAKCKQKKTWVKVFARLHEHDPWRAHWIVVDGSCNCGILDLTIGR